MGSSPLARGLPAWGSPGRPSLRIIPARAGFTRRRDGAATPLADHPRSRGVYLRDATIAKVGGGSSPLARGLRVRVSAGRPSRGIIPARAGFTSCARSWASFRWDHPRSRGVYWPDTFANHELPGSSPLARGLPRRRAPWSVRRTDHPRSRGVYTYAKAGVSLGTGSSPLARGLRDLRRVSHSCLWIIPARAGFTLSLRSPPSLRRDHPRSRGVYIAVMPWFGFRRGSSPLARGLPRPLISSAAFCADHPRSRGVYQSREQDVIGMSGSSPLARGLPA